MLTLAPRSLLAEKAPSALGEPLSPVVLFPPNQLAPIPRPERFEEFERAYRVSWVHACVAKRARAASRIPVQITRPSGKAIASSHPLAQLLADVNPRTTLKQLLFETTAFRDLTGNAYWLINPDPRGRPAELWGLRPDRVEVIPDRVGLVEAYLYRNNTVVNRFAEERVIHFRSFSPTHDYYGQGELSAAWDAVHLLADSHTWNRSFLRNAGRLDGIFTTDQRITEEQAKSIAQRMREMIAGPANAGRVLVTGQGFKYEAMSATPKEVDFIESLKQHREEILGVFGVPPVLFGIEQGDIGRRTEQITNFYQQTIDEICSELADTLQEFLVWRYGEALRIGFDVEGELARIADRLLLAQIDEIRLRTGQRTVNELRRRDGLEPVEWGETWWTQVSTIPVERAGEILDGRGGERGDNAGVAAPEGEGRPESSEDGAREPTPPQGERGLKALDAETREKAWWKFARLTEELETSFRAGLRRVFAAVEGAVEDDLRRGISPEGVITGAEVLTRQLLEGLGHERFPSVLEAGWERGIDLVTQQLGERALRLVWPTRKAALELVFDLAIPGIAAFLSSRPAEYATTVAATIGRDLRQVVAVLADQGASVDTIARQLVEELQTISVARSRVIARTEVIGAANRGALESYRASGVVAQQEWLSARDERARASHLAADGQETALGGVFSVGGATLRYPGDPAGPPEETVNCRCTTLPVVRVR